MSVKLCSAVLTPRQTDVLPGNQKYQGNKLYTQLIKNQKKDYVYATMLKDTKSANTIVQSICDGVRNQSPPGRFLSKNKDGAYSIKSKHEVFVKIKKALNENRKSIEYYFEIRGKGLTMKKEGKSIKSDALKMIKPKEKPKRASSVRLKKAKGSNQGRINPIPLNQKKESLKMRVDNDMKKVLKLLRDLSN